MKIKNVFLLQYMECFLNLTIELFNEVNQHIVRGCSLSLFEYNGKEFKIDYIGKDDFLEPRNTKISYK